MPGPKEVQPTNPASPLGPASPDALPFPSHPHRPVLSFQGPGYLPPRRAGAGRWSPKVPGEILSESAEPRPLPASAATLRQKPSPGQKLQEPAVERV